MPTLNAPSEAAMDARARRAARRVDLYAKKSTWRRDSTDNYGGFQLIDPQGNYVVAGSSFDLSPEDVIELCEGRSA